MESDMIRLYAWLADSGDEEGRWAAANPRDRTDVIRVIQSLPDSPLVGVALR